MNNHKLLKMKLKVSVHYSFYFVFYIFIDYLHKKINTAKKEEAFDSK